MGFLIKFFIRDGIQSRRTLWLGILGLFPVGLALILRLFSSPLARQGIEAAALFPRIGFLLFLHFLMPLVAVFIGSGLIADEVEGRTLPYLLVRPIPRAVLVMSKALAGWLTSAVILAISIAAVHAILALPGGLDVWWGDLGEFLRILGVLLLGLAAYTAFFGMLGALLKHPVLAGLLFTFGWENMVSFFPGNVKFFTIVHYLHTLFPHMRQFQSQNIQTQLLSFIIKTRGTAPALAIGILVALTAVFTGGMVLVLMTREYRLDEV
ncbi:MAG TPA: hypothetical protein ENN03_00885 [bacterium]|nr:hypothetical protein [bacterium]